MADYVKEGSKTRIFRCQNLMINVLTRRTKARDIHNMSPHSHTDFEQGFIRAETIAYEDYVAGGGEAGARETGKMRLEGKDYSVQDGDVMHFRFAT